MLQEGHSGQKFRGIGVGHLQSIWPDGTGERPWETDTQTVGLPGPLEKNTELRETLSGPVPVLLTMRIRTI